MSPERSFGQLYHELVTRMDGSRILEYGLAMADYGVAAGENGLGIVAAQESLGMGETCRETLQKAAEGLVNGEALAHDVFIGVAQGALDDADIAVEALAGQL